MSKLTQDEIDAIGRIEHKRAMLAAYEKANPGAMKHRAEEFHRPGIRTPAELSEFAKQERRILVAFEAKQNRAMGK